MAKKVQTLLLNANREPRALVPVERAFLLQYEDGDKGDGIGKIDVIVTAESVTSGEIPEGMRVWRSVRQEHPVPLVVRLREMQSPLFDLFHVDIGKPTLEALMRRDHGHCLYCLRTQKDLGRNGFFTIDHIVPRWRFKAFADANRWENVALACNSCNNAKGGRTPEEAGMTLHGVPLVPTEWQLVRDDLLECQKAFVDWLWHGAPWPAMIAA